MKMCSLVFAQFLQQHAILVIYDFYSFFTVKQNALLRCTNITQQFGHSAIFFLLIKYRDI